jgi:hypothetical protein
MKRQRRVTPRRLSRAPKPAWRCVEKVPLGLSWSADSSAHKIPVFWMQWRLTEHCAITGEYRVRVELGAPVYPMDRSQEVWLAFKVFCQVAPMLESAAKGAIR